MAKVDEGLLAQFEKDRGQPRLFQDRLDADFLDAAAKDRAQSMGAHVSILPRASQLDPTGVHEAAGVDTLDGDVLDPEFLNFSSVNDTKIDIDCIVDHEPSKQILRKFGLDEKRDVVFYFPAILLKEAGLINTEKRFRGLAIGDVIEWDGTYYVVQSVHRDGYLGQSDHFVWVAGFCDRYRLTNPSKAV